MKSNFNKYYFLRILNFAFVGSKLLEYTCLIWHSDEICTTQNLEAVQNYFPLYLSFKFKIERQRYTEYNGLLNIFSHYIIESLNTRRDYLQFIFLHIKLLNNTIDFLYLVKQLKFQINNKSTKSQNCFLINNISKTYLRSSPVNILMNMENITELNLFCLFIKYSLKCD